MDQEHAKKDLQVLSGLEILSQENILMEDKYFILKNKHNNVNFIKNGDGISLILN